MLMIYGFKKEPTKSVSAHSIAVMDWSMWWHFIVSLSHLLAAAFSRHIKASELTGEVFPDVNFYLSKPQILMPGF